MSPTRPASNPGTSPRVKSDVRWYSFGIRSPWFASWTPIPLSASALIAKIGSTMNRLTHSRVVRCAPSGTRRVRGHIATIGASHSGSRAA